MTRGAQYACVLAGLLLCLALATLGIGSHETLRTPVPAGDSAIGAVPAADAAAPSSRPRPTASIVPEGVAVLLATIIWTVSMALLSASRIHDPLRRALSTLSRRRTVPS